MQRIRLTKNAKRILKELSNGVHYVEISEEDDLDGKLLWHEKLITGIPNEAGTIMAPRLSELGELYLHINPKLKNPSIWEDKKYWITTSISLAALIMSIIAILI